MDTFQILWMALVQENMLRLSRPISFDSLAIITQVGELGPVQELMHHGVFSILSYAVFNHSNGGICILIYDRLFESLQWSEIAPAFSFMLWHMLDICLKRIACILENRSSIKLGWQFCGPLHPFIAHAVCQLCLARGEEALGDCSYSSCAEKMQPVW